MPANRKGFTLVELVMVVAILGVFSVLLVPNFVDYLRKSQASTTKANLQMLRSAIQAYRSENSSQSPKRLDTLIPLYLPQLPGQRRSGYGSELRARTLGA